MATETTTQPAAALSVAEKLEMSLDEIAKRDKAERLKKLREERKKKRQEKKKEKAAEAPKKEAAGKKEGAGAKGDKQQQQKKTQQRESKAPKEKASESDKAAEKPPLTTGTPVLVKNLDEGVDAPSLKDIFEEAGPIKSIELLPARGNQPPAAKIIFKIKADAEKAVAEFNDRLLDGKKIHVKLLKKRVLTSSKDNSKKQENGQENRKRQKRSD